MISIEDKHKIESLLALVTEIRWQQARRRSETAADFDFFTAVSRLRDENRHSRFIASLLNPHGRHCQGMLFLQHFLAELGLPPADQADANRWWVRTEVAVSDKRRIDVWINGPDRTIGIEAKIDHHEGKDQLFDYATALSRESGEKRLVFLTTDGRQPKDHENLQVKVISCRYGCDPLEIIASNDLEEVDDERAVSPPRVPSITSWLRRCLPDLINVTRVRDIVLQYLDVLGKLEGQTMNEAEKTEIANIVSRGENFESMLKIEESVLHAKANVQHAFWEELRSALGLQTFDRGQWELIADDADYPRILEFIRSQSNEKPRLIYDTGFKWLGLKLGICIELLKHGKLTCKVQCFGHDGFRVDADVIEKTIAGKTKDFDRDGSRAERITKELSAIQTRLRELSPMKMNSTDFSLVTGDLTVNGRTLDLIRFRGKTRKLARKDERERIVEGVVEQIKVLRSATEQTTLDKPTPVAVPMTAYP